MIHYIFSIDKVFMLMLTMDSFEKKEISSIPVVCEFAGVFPKDVTSLPPKRGVEFSIDLVVGITHVSILLIECII